MGINLGNIKSTTETHLNQGVETTTNNKGEMVLNLSKGISLDLTKELPDLNVLRFGLGWDTISGQDIDLDIFAFAQVNGRVVSASDITYFRQRNSVKGIFLSEDNQTGEGEGDDETIIINKNQLESRITTISIFANTYDQNLNFGMLKNVYIRLINDETGKEEAIYVLNKEAGMNNAFHFVDLELVNGRLTFKIVGQPLNGDINKILQRYV